MRNRAAGTASGRATDRELGVVAAVLVAGSEKAAAHRLGLSHSTLKHHLASARSKEGATTTAQLVWILAQSLRDAQEHLGGMEARAPAIGRFGGVNRQGEDPTNRPELPAAGRVYDDRDIP